MNIKRNLEIIEEVIENHSRIANRESSEIQLIPVTKYRDLEQTNEVIDAGYTTLSESRVQETQVKIEQLDRPGLTWHLIGRLQTNKAKYAVQIFDLIHSVDSLRLLEALNKEAGKFQKKQNVLLQVNISGEETKAGFTEDELVTKIEDFFQLTNLNIIGLMTMAPHFDDPEQTRPVFRALAQLRDQLNSSGYESIRELSMGMSNDYMIAVEEGATKLRLGSIIFQE